MSELSDLYEIKNPEDPFIMGMKSVGVFGGSEAPVDFSFGGASVLPSVVDQNPEDYIALPESIYAQGIVKPGQGIRIINPETKKVVVGIARHIQDENSGHSMDLAPHTILELGGTKNLLVDFRPVTNYPIAKYSTPYVPKEAEPQPETLADVSVSGAMTPENEKPGMRNASTIDSATSTGPAASGEVKNKDGSITYPTGITVFLNGMWTKQVGDETFYYSLESPNKPVKIENKKEHRQMQDFTDQSTGQTYKALVDTHSGEIVKKFIDPGTRANAQAEMLRVRIINSAKSQPAIVGYVNVKNNYDSLAQNADIPADQRTGADDAAAIQAFGAIEHPGTGVTDADKKQAEGLVPLWSKLKIKLKNLRDTKANVLDAETVKQMRDAAKRALDGRQKTYSEEIAPLLKEAQRVGLTPEQVNGALGANVIESKAATSPAPTPISTVKPGGRIKDKSGKFFQLKPNGDPNNPADYEELP